MMTFNFLTHQGYNWSWLTDPPWIISTRIPRDVEAFIKWEDSGWLSVSWLHPSEESGGLLAYCDNPCHKCRIVWMICIIFFYNKIVWQMNDLIYLAFLMIRNSIIDILHREIFDNIVVTYLSRMSFYISSMTLIFLFFNPHPLSMCFCQATWLVRHS